MARMGHRRVTVSAPTNAWSLGPLEEEDLLAISFSSYHAFQIGIMESVAGINFHVFYILLLILCCTIPIISILMTCRTSISAVLSFNTVYAKRNSVKAQTNLKIFHHQLK